MGVDGGDELRPKIPPEITGFEEPSPAAESAAKDVRIPLLFQKKVACSPFLGPVIMGVTCSFIQ